MHLTVLLLVVLQNTSIYTSSAKPVATAAAAVLDTPFTLQCRNNSLTHREEQARNCSWTRNNKPIRKSNTNFNMEGFKLKIRRFIWRRKQQFQCSCIPSRSQSFTITAERAPHVNVNMAQGSGRWERIHFNLTAKPEPVITDWYGILSNGILSRVDPTRSRTELKHISGISYRLQLDHVDVTDKDAGVYIVNVSNARGSYVFNYSIVVRDEMNTDLPSSSPLFIGASVALALGILALVVGCCLTCKAMSAGLGKRAAGKYRVTYITPRTGQPETIEDEPGSEWESESIKDLGFAVSGGVTDDCIYESRDYELPHNATINKH
ncbi:uncharacterized protein LOC124280046 isoform X2 [Haliotis rubra]|uniref:uncharacterized protein LOC124280046 isoform X2 n=1 Tax=Haliotis rubra TaxID=36100 RepID=UPI001EE5ED2C|nr:uncharacterized protein LOC124280046 isoform X2 [Haliotis rubra]